jgi:glycosyltransferase involved in cell wall biosynthesis
MTKPFVSVLIDTYNHESFIADAIQSVLSQDFTASEREILVVDDGSTDRTPDIVRQFEPHVRLLRKPNGGQASAFNAGFPEMRGEIVAFLDGDDWWDAGKLKAVTEAFAANPTVDLVGHGLTEVYPDGRQRVEVPRETSRLRILSVAEARQFRMLRGFFGTSRMSYRKEILRSIGKVPESLKFEADEYLFTVAPLLGEALVLNRSLTFYRLHERNLYQITAGSDDASRKKYQVIAALADALREKLRVLRISPEIARAVLESVEVEAELLHLMLDSGFPWETIGTELKVLRVFHNDASFFQHLLSYARLLPAIALPSRTYYRCRSRLSKLSLYVELRRRFLPFPVPDAVERIDKPAAGTQR